MPPVWILALLSPPHGKADSKSEIGIKKSFSKGLIKWHVTSMVPVAKYARECGSQEFFF
jgi:hypothetical protein